MIRVSLFSNAHDNQPKEVETTWDQFVATLGPHRFDFHPDAKEHGALPMFSPAHYPPGKTRGLDNVVSVSFGVLDVDHVSAAQLYDVITRVEPFNAVLYTTWSHSKHLAEKGLWSARICLEFTRPLEAREWRAFWPRFAGYFGMVADPKCKDSSRPYFGAFAPPGTEVDAAYVVFQGRAFDVDSLKGGDAPPPVQGTEKIPRDRLERLAARWKRSRDEWRCQMGHTLDRVCKGEPFAEPGQRDTTIFQLAQDLAEAFPGAEPMSIAVHFAQSLQVMGPDSPSVEDVASKLARAIGSKAQEIAEDQEAEITERKLRIRQSFAHIDPARDWPYTETEILAMAEKLRVSRNELQKRWIIQRGNLFYVLGPGAVYGECYTDKDVTNAVLRDLAPASSAAVSLWTAPIDGTPIRKGLSQLMSEYGTVATNYLLDLRAQEAEYEQGQRLFIEAPCPLRPLTPSYDSDVAAWLEILCGAKTTDVLNWMALATFLDETCAALMLTGAKGTGKSLFAHGMARLWRTSGPVPLTSAMGDFNDALARCPLLFADEQLPKDFRGYGRTAELRELIAARSRPFKKKFYPETVILGCTRLVIAANNEDILAIVENLSVNDIEAIGDRFYHIKVRPEAAEFLRFCDAGSFVTEDKIARHALWLRDNHAIRRDGRFLIRQADRTFYRALTTKSGIRSSVCQWLVGYLRDPRRVDIAKTYQARVSKKRLLVTTRVILDNWQLYVPNETVPSTGRLASAIAGLSKDERPHLSVPGGPPANYRWIDTEHIIAWAQETEFATADEIRAALSVDTEDRAAVAAGR